MSNLENVFSVDDTTSISYLQILHPDVVDLIITRWNFDDNFKINFNNFPNLRRLTINANKLIYDQTD